MDSWLYADLETIIDCYQDGPKAEKPKTNADRIRAMSDEELADFFWKIENATRNDHALGKDGWLDWLRQEVNDDKS